MTTPEYIATVYGRGAMTEAHPTMRAAFAWVRDCVGRGDWSYTHGRVMLSDDLLCEFDAQSTRWHADGYERWEADK